MAPPRKKASTKAVTRGKAATKAKSGKAKSTARKSVKSAPGITKPDPLDGLIDAAARAFALEIKPEWNPAVRAHLQVIFRQAALFTEFELPDDAEPAPIFRA
jgi:Protein of unknown function (DUF4089)